MRDESRPPSLDIDAATRRLRLSGSWTLAHAGAMAEALRLAPEDFDGADASDVERVDSAGVLQLLRFARRRGVDLDVFEFREDHRALVEAIEDVADDRPKKKREYGVGDALEHVGVTRRASRPVGSSAWGPRVVGCWDSRRAAEVSR